MRPFINPPEKIPFLIHLGLIIARRITGKEMLPAKILAWYPRAAIGSGLLESLTAHRDGRLNERILKIVRLQASYAVACPFCIDMNSFHYDDQITNEELKALQGRIELEDISTFSDAEKLAIRYARLISQTPLQFPEEFIEKLKRCFHEREIVILASTAAQVNYWARLIQALGVPPAGFTSQCELGE